jgi:hypothetical protein
MGPAGVGAGTPTNLASLATLDKIVARFNIERYREELADQRDAKLSELVGTRCVREIPTQ